MNFLFWNIAKKPIAGTISLLCKEHNIDILILAESEYTSSDLLLQLNNETTLYHHNSPISNCKKIQIYTRFHFDYIAPINETHRYTFRELALPNIEKILLVGIHFPDKVSFSPQSQMIEVRKLVDNIYDEKGNEFCNKIIIGDFNMNPFEEPMVSTVGFNATKSSVVALKGKRTVQDVEYKYFYNPMWSLFGDLNAEISGTYYYSKAEHINFKWNIFDQFLLSPALIDKFDKSSLKIISGLADGTSFLNQSKRPNKNIYSDHLPFVFTLNL